jgi:hypothetical protein
MTTQPFPLLPVPVTQTTFALVAPGPTESYNFANSEIDVISPDFQVLNGSTTIVLSIDGVSRYTVHVGFTIDTAVNFDLSASFTNGSESGIGLPEFSGLGIGEVFASLRQLNGDVIYTGSATGTAVGHGSSSDRECRHEYRQPRSWRLRPGPHPGGSQWSCQRILAVGPRS